MSAVQPSYEVMEISDTKVAPRNGRYVKLILPIVGIGIVLTIVSLALIVATLVTVNNRFDEIKDTGDVQPTISTPSTSSPITTTPTTQQSTQLPINSTLAESISIAEVMTYLNELQRIATSENGTRAINTPGFNRTLDYIANYLEANTNYNVTKSFFPVRLFALARNPILLSSIDGTVINHTYSANLSIAEFYHVQYSVSVNFSSYVSLAVIPNVGCTEADWQAVIPPMSGQVALVKRGDCTFIEKAELATKFNVSALLLYNDGTAPDRFAPINTNLGQTNTLPALFLSFNLGQKLVEAAENVSNNAGVRIEIDVANDLPFPVGNICADTPTGDVTQTIVVGSHSDSVPAGPGINDNGSGSAANLGLAVALARLFRTPSYAKYKYRVRFCWWGAEEVGLLGSADHVEKAKNSTVVGERLQDYLINLNFDMLGSPNYIFGIYDGTTATNTTPASAIPGSNKISALFRDWFIRQNLPWDFTDFSGRSDYGPFLEEGIVAGGLFSGGDDIKTQEQRDRYDQVLGQGLGGIAGADQDPCYHLACDSIQNINVFAMEKMVQAAAYVIESLGREDNLKTWLYPTKAIQQLETRSREHRVYNSINEYFGLPYF